MRYVSRCCGCSYEDSTITDCCQVEGCNQPSAQNYFGEDAFGCEVPAAGGGMELDPNDIRWCEFIGCGDEESYLFGEQEITGYPGSVWNTWGTLTTPDGTTIYGYSGATDYEVGALVQKDLTKNMAFYLEAVYLSYFNRENYTIKTGLNYIIK